MSAPKRWLDDSEGALPGERDLLRAGLTMDPPPGAQGEVWTALLAKIPPPGAPPPNDGGASAAGKSASTAAKTATAAKGAAASKAAGVAVAGGLVKSALIGAGSAVALLATYTVVTPSAPEPTEIRASASVVEPRASASGIARNEPRASASTHAMEARASASGPEPHASASAIATTTGPHAPASPTMEPRAYANGIATAEPVVERETMLREESRLVGEARDALRRGDAPGAIAMLEQIRTRFPGGVLTQEREALAIEALARSGRRDEASSRAAAFVNAYPTSPLAARVQSFVK